MVVIGVCHVVSATSLGTNANTNVSPPSTSSAAANVVTKIEAVKPGMCLVKPASNHNCLSLVQLIKIVYFVYCCQLKYTVSKTGVTY